MIVGFVIGFLCGVAVGLLGFTFYFRSLSGEKFPEE